MIGLKQVWCFQYFVQFANLFLNVFLLYFRFCHTTCVALHWTNHLNGRRRFLCIEVHRDCPSWRQCSTVWRHKAIRSKGLYRNSCCCINYRLQYTWFKHALHADCWDQVNQCFFHCAIVTASYCKSVHYFSCKIWRVSLLFNLKTPIAIWCHTSPKYLSVVA